MHSFRRAVENGDLAAAEAVGAEFDRIQREAQTTQ